MEEALLKRWRLILGGNEADGTGVSLSAEESRVDAALNALYDSDRKGGLSGSAPKVSRWLGDIREFFPQTVVQVIQKDAIKRLNLTSLLTEKEMLESVVPDVHLVATLMSLSRVIPEKNKVIAREVVRKVVDELMKGGEKTRTEKTIPISQRRCAPKQRAFSFGHWRGCTV